jgi:hypothetical protein
MRRLPRPIAPWMRQWKWKRTLALILRTLDSPTTFLAEKRSDKGFLLLPHQRPLRLFHEALVFEAPFRSPPP